MCCNNYKIPSVLTKFCRMNLTNEKTTIGRELLTKPYLYFLLLPLTNELLNFLTLKNTKELVKSLNRSNMPFVLNFEPITIGILQKI